MAQRCCVWCAWQNYEKAKNIKVIEAPATYTSAYMRHSYYSINTTKRHFFQQQISVRICVCVL